MAKTSTEWVRTLTPFIIIGIGGLVGWGRTNAELTNLSTRLIAECQRSKEIDKVQDAGLRSAQLTIGRMEEKITAIKETVDRSAGIQDEVLKELRNR